MRKYLVVFLSLLLLYACYKTPTDTTEINWQQLTRVDYHDYEGSEVIIVEEEQLSKLVNVFESVFWQQNVMVKMSREEEGKITLFVQKDKNMPERLYEYYIWFNIDGSAEVVDRENSAYGKLDKENTEILKDFFKR
ncbi:MULTISPECIES: hypothetical protein [Bacillus]|uniref:hypothetical protein n=1 Tax=Bacillus TaxID=1386 RepID=UPI000BB98689|nr:MULTISPECIES: hypothetical protein [Bacillus]